MLKCPRVLQPPIPRWPADCPIELGSGWRSHSDAPAPCGTAPSPQWSEGQGGGLASRRKRWGWVRAQVCSDNGFPSSPGAEIPSDSAARGHGGLAHPIPLNGAGASEAKGIGGQDSWWTNLVLSWKKAFLCIFVGQPGRSASRPSRHPPCQLLGAVGHLGHALNSTVSKVAEKQQDVPAVQSQVWIRPAEGSVDLRDPFQRGTAHTRFIKALTGATSSRVTCNNPKENQALGDGLVPQDTCPLTALGYLQQMSHW